MKDGASSFAKQAQTVTFDLTNDNGDPGKRQMTWDKKKKKFIQGDGAGADNVKMVKTESGTRLPATFRSGRFDEWKSKSRVSIPRVGETENTSSRNIFGQRGRRFMHNKVAMPKPLDKLRGDYKRKVRQGKKKETDAKLSSEDKEVPSSERKKRYGLRHSAKSIGRVKTEIKTAEQIRKQRKLVEKRRAKNARPSYSSGKKKSRR